MQRGREVFVTSGSGTPVPECNVFVAGEITHGNRKGIGGLVMEAVENAFPGVRDTYSRGIWDSAKG